MITITLPDGSQVEYPKGTKAKVAVKNISKGLYRESVGVIYNGIPRGLDERLLEDGDFVVVKFDDPRGKQIFWHTAAHVLANAVKNLYPDAKFAIGPAIDDGFYYDIDSEHRFVPEDLEAIENEMLRIASEGHLLEEIDMTREDAIKYFEEQGEKYKVELIQDLPEDEVITLYKSGDFVDLCAGPHLEDTSKIKAVKLLSIAGAYWRGDENNEMLQRIYGVAFQKQSELKDYLEMREEAEKRDHRKLGKELDLFSFSEMGPGFAFFHPKGTVLRNVLLDWWRGVLENNGYGEIITPIILNEQLWHQSGHWGNYKENMYFTEIDGSNYAVKPMNCPGASLYYNSKQHSYRDLPLRISEFGLVHRHELSGALHGLFRVRSFTQDDAHIFCLPDQIEDEVFRMIDLADYLYSTFGFEYSLELSTRPENYMGEIADWYRAEAALKAALEKRDLEYVINEGDGAFYGPKIDFQLEDAIGRTWQCGTIQLDFQMPQNFDMTYVDSDGERKRPVMLHRALLGSIERFLGILVEHFAGRFPLWIAPIQIRVLPVSDNFRDYAEEVSKKFMKAGFRVEVDERSEQLGYKIREAQGQRIPYVLVVGANEQEAGNVSVRAHSEDLGAKDIDELIADLKEEVETQSISRN